MGLGRRPAARASRGRSSTAARARREQQSATAARGSCAPPPSSAPLWWELTHLDSGGAAQRNSTAGTKAERRTDKEG